MSHIVSVLNEWILLSKVVENGEGESLEKHVDINHPNMYALKTAVDRGAHKLTVKKVSDRWGTKTTNIDIGYHVPSHWKEFSRPITGSISHYDPHVAHVDHSEPDYPAIRPKDPHAMTSLPEKGEPGVIYRGMSHEEYQHSLKRGSFQSEGSHNIGDAQKGLTYFSSEPRQAQGYAHGFAPWYHSATPHHPAVVVAVKDRKNYEVHPNYPTELGVRGSVPTSDIHHVFIGKPYHVRPGSIDVRTDHNGPQEGSRMSPSASLIWHREDKQQ